MYAKVWDVLSFVLKTVNALHCTLALPLGLGVSPKMHTAATRRDRTIPSAWAAGHRDHMQCGNLTFIKSFYASIFLTTTMLGLMESLHQMVLYLLLQSSNMT
jgi:hypothetical protein